MLIMHRSSVDGNQTRPIYAAACADRDVEDRKAAFLPLRLPHQCVYSFCRVLHVYNRSEATMCLYYQYWDTCAAMGVAVQFAGVSASCTWMCRRDDSQQRYDVAD